MQLRSIILAGVCAALTFGAPAYAATPAAQASSQPAAANHLVTVAAKSATAELKALKKKKKPTDDDLARIKDLEKQVKAEKAAAAAKALEAKKLAMREAAKAKAAGAREAFLMKKGAKETTEVAEAKPAAKKKLVKVDEPVVAVAEPLPIEAQEVALNGNSGELRSEAPAAKQDTGLFAGLFGGGVSRSAMLPQTRALDAVLEKKTANKKFKVKPEFEPQEVEFTGYAPGTIVINTGERRLYLVESSSSARRYAIAVGRDGLQFKGKVAVGDKQEWPRWIPTLEMQAREPKKYGQYKDGMNGGPENPLGARAIYLYQGKKDTHLRIHGTNQPQSIGTSASNGCFRMINDHVMDLYRRVKVGTQVVVL